MEIREYTSAELGKLSIDELKELAADIRQFILKAVSKNGGHLASNLGVVELTIALHRVFDINGGDSIVWDVGHQSYTHKILTGRGDRFAKLRKLGGLSGFPKYEEDKRDTFNTGHSSTSISAAAGIAKANCLRGIKAKSIAVIGDGAMTGGMAYEALNHAGHNTKNLIIIYNDNDMSISKNVGGVSRAMKRLRNANKYLKFKDDFKTALGNIPVVGEPTKKGLIRVKTDIKNMVVDGNAMFESMGFSYLGPVNGHDFEKLIAVLKYAKNKTKPVFIHVCTKKGKGYKPAEQEPDLYHGVGSFDIKSGKLFKSSKRESWSKCFGRTLCGLADENEKIAAVTAAMPDGTGLSRFAEKFSDRFFDVGIAEQHAVTFSAGLARAGIIPVFAVYSTFLQRAYDQILHDVCLQNLHVVFAVDRSGPVGSDGETHQGVYDISYFSHMPNMRILSPAICEDMEPMLKSLIDGGGPCAIRYPRGAACTADDYDAEIPRLTPDKCAEPRVIVSAGTPDVLIVSTGVMLKNALGAARILEDKGYSAAVADAVCLKPFDPAPVKDMADRAKIVASVENNVINGGFGRLLEDALDKKILKLAYPDEPVCQGKVAELEERYGLSADKIAERIEERLKQI